MFQTKSWRASAATVERAPHVPRQTRVKPFADLDRVDAPRSAKSLACRLMPSGRIEVQAGSPGTHGPGVSNKIAEQINRFRSALRYGETKVVASFVTKRSAK